MTCIVGIKSDGEVYIGGDSAGVSDYSLRQRADPKVFRIGSFVMGFTSSFRMGQLLAHSLEPPPVPEKPSQLFGYMTKDFINTARKCLADGGYQRTVNGSDEGGTFMVGVAGRLFVIYSDYQVAESLSDFEAIGCGSDLAIGAMAAMQNCRPSLKPQQRLVKALEITERFSSGVCGPFKTMKSSAPKKRRSSRGLEKILEAA